MKEPGWPFGNHPPARLLWEVWKSGRIMSCELNEHPLGWEIRYYVRGLSGRLKTGNSSTGQNRQLPPADRDK